MAHATRSKIDAFGIQYEGNVGLLDLAVLVGGVTVTASASVASDRADRANSPRRSPPCARGWVSSCCCWRWPRVAWWSTADRMAGMDAGPGTDLGALGWFLGVWVVMMAAMMFPSLAPTVALYARMTRRRGPDRPLLFASGYLLVWGAAGLGAYGLFASARTCFGGDLAWHAGGRWFAAGVLAFAALYELTPAEESLPGEVPQSAGVPARNVARRAARRAADGLQACRLVLGLLLGADGRAVRSRDHESHVDGIRRGTDRPREDPSVAPRGDLGHSGHPARARDRRSMAAPHAVPGLVVPGGAQNAMHAMH